MDCFGHIAVLILRRHYRRAKTITLILDNYIIHKSKQTEQWLKQNPKFRLIFQPVYSPWVNHIERLWHCQSISTIRISYLDRYELLTPPFIPLFNK